MLSPRWHKIIRDLWSNKTRTVLIILSIAVGIFAFGSVFITQDVLVKDMATQYRDIHPSTITIYSNGFDDRLVDWARRQPEVASAQGRAVYSVKLIKGDQELNLDLYVSDDWPNLPLNQVTPQTGSWPPQRGQISMERDSISASGGAIGDKIIVETASGNKRYDLSLVGTVHDLNAFPASMFPQLSGYISQQTAEDLGFPAYYNRLEMAAQPQYVTAQALETVANSLKDRLLRAGVTVGSVSVREPDEHWARQTTQSFTLILSVIGFFSLVLSGFLVVNTVSALLSEQRRQIGIMKAVGGTARQIVGLYFMLVTVYGVLALLLALPVGMGLGYIFTKACANFLNIDILNFHLPMYVFWMQLAAALAVPVIASAMPILGGVRVTTREAMSTYGIKQKGDHGLVARLVLLVRFLPRPLLLSLRNTFRRKARLSLSLGSLAIAGMLFITVINVRDSLMLELDHALNASFNFEVLLALNNNYERVGLERKAESVPGVKQVEGRTSASAQYVKADGTKGSTFSIEGIAPDTNFVNLTITDGRWLQNKDRNSIVISNTLAKEMPGVAVGDEITLNSANKNQKWRVVGIAYMSTERTAYADFDYLSALQGVSGKANTLYVRTDPNNGLSQDQMAQNLESALKKSGIGVAATVTKDSIVSSNTGQFNFLVAFLLSMAAMTALIGALGLAGMMSLNVMERTREIGIMRSIGASHSAIGSIVATEGLLIGFISWIMAVPLSLPFQHGL